MPPRKRFIEGLRKACTPGRLLLSATSLFTILGPYKADFDDTHIYNDAWTPHAKFHTGQTMSMGAALGALGLYFLWGRPHYDKAQARLATTFASLYWITQASATLYPNTALVDPPRDPREGRQPLMIAIVLGVNGLAYALESIRMSRPEQLVAVRRMTRQDA